MANQGVISMIDKYYKENKQVIITVDDKNQFRGRIEFTTVGDDNALVTFRLKDSEGRDTDTRLNFTKNTITAIRPFGELVSK